MTFYKYWWKTGRDTIEQNVDFVYKREETEKEKGGKKSYLWFEKGHWFVAAK